MPVDGPVFETRLDPNPELLTARNEQGTSLAVSLYYSQPDVSLPARPKCGHDADSASLKSLRSLGSAA